jgi:hypothetical protein
LSQGISSSNRQFREILQNPKLARLGDAYVNFLLSLALTQFTGTPAGIKVSDKILFEAAKKSGIRTLLPRRMKRGQIANVVEAMIVDSWLKKSLSLEEMLQIMMNDLDNLPNAITRLLKEIIERMNNS